MRLVYALIFVLLLTVVALLGAGAAQLHLLFGVVLPYAAFAVLIGGTVFKLISWARSPVPFRIPTTCGQQKTLPWIKSDNLESPHNLPGVLGRMALEILLFRSLFRNTTSEIRDGKIVVGGEKWLWLFGLLFHWTFLIVFMRHFRFFMEPVPVFVHWLQDIDGIMQFGMVLPALYLTDIVFLAAVTFLFLRRVVLPRVRYISLVADYFPLFLIFAIG